MKTGLLGRKLGHSYSPQIHRNFGDYQYSLFEKEPEEVADFLKNGDFSAINVTYPYKKTVMPYCELSPVAQKIGAVNTIVRQPDGSLIGHNTDFFGFRSMVRKSGLNPSGKKCLVLGSGGASATAVAVLEEMGASVVIISRSGENNYANLHLHADASILCNCTPVGMYPNNGVSPIYLSKFPKLEGVLDVVYNPAKTKLLLDAEERGIVAMNGLWMLVAQAKEASEWFTGKALPEDCIEAVYQKLRLEMENIILIGMPGCGKTTVGKALARRLGKEFVDADAELEKRVGRPISQIIPEDGEAYFRKLETQTLEVLGKQSGLVIATGGGCVTRDENWPLMRQNGQIVWLQRDLGRLPTHGRPLSQTNKLEDLYARREPLYRKWADHIIDNNGTKTQATDRILAALEGNA